MRSSIKIIQIIAIVAIGVSCTEELKPTPYTYTKRFTGENNKTWQIKLFEETLNGEVVNRFTINCMNDDKFIFYANAEHLYETRSGFTKCFQDEPDVTVSNWTFNNGTATLTMVVPIISDNSLPFIVKRADESKLHVELFLDEANTSSYRIQFDAIDEQ